MMLKASKTIAILAIAIEVKSIYEIATKEVPALTPYLGILLGTEMILLAIQMCYYHKRDQKK